MRKYLPRQRDPEPSQYPLQRMYLTSCCRWTFLERRERWERFVILYIYRQDSGAPVPNQASPIYVRELKLAMVGR